MELRARHVPSRKVVLFPFTFSPVFNQFPSPSLMTSSLFKSVIFPRRTPIFDTPFQHDSQLAHVMDVIHSPNTTAAHLYFPLPPFLASGPSFSTLPPTKSNLIRRDAGQAFDVDTPPPRQISYTEFFLPPCSPLWRLCGRIGTLSDSTVNASFPSSNHIVPAMGNTRLP